MKILAWQVLKTQVLICGLLLYTHIENSYYGLCPLITLTLIIRSSDIINRESADKF